MRKLTLNELKERLLNGEEFVFNFQGNEYWISQTEEKLYLTLVSKGISQEFESVTDLLEEGELNSIPFKVAFNVIDL